MDQIIGLILCILVLALLFGNSGNLFGPFGGLGSPFGGLFGADYSWLWVIIIIAIIFYLFSGRGYEYYEDGTEFYY